MDPNIGTYVFLEFKYKTVSQAPLPFLAKPPGGNSNIVSRMRPNIPPPLPESEMSVSHQNPNIYEANKVKYEDHDNDGTQMLGLINFMNLKAAYKTL